MVCDSANITQYTRGLCGVGMGARHEKSGRGHVVVSVSELHEFCDLYQANALYSEKLLITWEIR